MEGMGMAWPWHGEWAWRRQHSIRMGSLHGLCLCMSLNAAAGASQLVV